jgi:hypothetical protein
VPRDSSIQQGRMEQECMTMQPITRSMDRSNPYRRFQLRDMWGALAPDAPSTTTTLSCHY